MIFSPFPTGLQTPNLLSQEPSPNCALRLPRTSDSRSPKDGQMFWARSFSQTSLEDLSDHFGTFFFGVFSSSKKKPPPFFSQVKRISLGCLVLKIEKCFVWWLPAPKFPPEIHLKVPKSKQALRLFGTHHW